MDTTTYDDAMGMFRSSWFKDLFADPSHNAYGATRSALPPATLLSTDPVLLVYATQTGAAEAIAADTCKKLGRTGSRIRMIDFNSLELPLLQSAHQALFVVSTTYDGDPPDMAEAFRVSTMYKPAALQGLMYGLLALGDRGYDDYCGFGRRLDDWLQASGAQAWFDRIDVDDENAGSIARWYRCMSMLSGREPESARIIPSP